MSSVDQWLRLVSRRMLDFVQKSQAYSLCNIDKRSRMKALIGAYNRRKSVHNLLKECSKAGKTWKTFEDSPQCIQIAQNNEYRGCPKHTELHFLAVQIVACRAQIDVQHCIAKKDQKMILTNLLQAEAKRQKDHLLSLTTLEWAERL